MSLNFRSRDQLGNILPGVAAGQDVQTCGLQSDDRLGEGRIARKDV
jgi:hypothetical protein